MTDVGTRVYNAMTQISDALDKSPTEVPPRPTTQLELEETQRLLQRALDHLEAVTVAGPYGRSRDRTRRFEDARRFLRHAGRKVNAERPTRGRRPTQS